LLRRLEIRAAAILLEWDEETGDVMMGLGPTRDVAWARYQAMNDALLRETGAAWVTEEIRERIVTRECGQAGGSPAALVWRAVFTPAGSSRYVAEFVAAAAGVSIDTLEVEP
jgi:hypothetical protein